MAGKGGRLEWPGVQWTGRHGGRPSGVAPSGLVSCALKILGRLAPTCRGQVRSKGGMAWHEAPCMAGGVAIKTPMANNVRLDIAILNRN